MKPLQHGLRILAGTLMGKVLCRVEDQYGVIQVSRRGDRRVLSFGSGLEQSSVSMGKPQYLCHQYTRMMLLGLIFLEARRIAIMGLGGGGLVHCLSHYYPHLTVRVIELRQAVIDVAYEWFDLPRTANVQVIHSDAMTYMSTIDASSHDIIFSDLYEAGGMSEVQGHRGYIEACYNALSDSGWLVLNFHTLPEEDSPLYILLSDMFPDIRVCHSSKGNRVMYCGKSACEYDDRTLRERARILEKHVQVPLMYYYRQLRRLDDQRVTG